MEVNAGNIVMKVRETAKTRTLPVVCPASSTCSGALTRDLAVVSHIAGEVSEQPEKKGKRILRVTPEIGDYIEYPIPKGRHLTVHTGDFVQPGEAMTEGQINPHDILQIKGLKALAAHMVNEVQEVYRLQGVKINDKHIETIVRQMLRRVRIISSGDSRFLLEDSISRRLRGGERALDGRGLDACSRRASAPRHHQGVAGHGLVDLGSLLPGDHQGAHPSLAQRSGRPPARRRRTSRWVA